MQLSKSLLLGTTLSILLAANPLYAKNNSSMTSTEVGTLATVAAIDKNEILISVIASNKNADSDVVKFAKMMINQHGSNLTQILEMAKNLNINTLTGGDAEKIVTAGKKEMLTLGGLNGKEFETAYANAMVAGHEAALNLIDQHLMKTAKSEEVKKFLTDTRAAVAQHLEHAKKLQEDLKS